MSSIFDLMPLAHPTRWIALTDCTRPVAPAQLCRRLPRGSLVIVRHPDVAEQKTLLQQILPIAHARGIKVSVAGNLPFAVRFRADGLHLPERQLRQRGRFRLRALRQRFVISTACHSLPALRQAAQAGVDLALLSPLFPTESHPGRRALGLFTFRQWAKSAGLPVYALGGITVRNLRLVLTLPVAGVAGVDMFATGVAATLRGGGATHRWGSISKKAEMVAL